jgi:hypothetical protein
MSAEARLKEPGIELPGPKPAVGQLLSIKREGILVFVPGTAVRSLAALRMIELSIRYRRRDRVSAERGVVAVRRPLLSRISGLGRRHDGPYRAKGGIYLNQVGPGRFCGDLVGRN